MAKGKDLTGQRFGKLIAIRPTEKRAYGGNIVWECKCDCGNICYVSTGDLRSGNTSSCGCIWNRKPLELVGKRFGMLTAIESTKLRKGSFVVWKCECDCGNTCFAPSANLSTGLAKTCSHYRLPGSQTHPLGIKGRRFGMLTALELTKTCDSDGAFLWSCKCDCGNVCYASARDLKSGNMASCGNHYIKLGPKIADLTGKRFGKLVTIAPTDKRLDNCVVWECKCDCGNTCYVPSRNLTKGNTKSCGCGKRVDLAGKKFGKLTVIEPTDQRKGSNVVWICKCDCGNTCYVSAHDLKHGNVKSCGCLKPGRKSIVSDAVDEKNISH